MVTNEKILNQYNVIKIGHSKIFDRTYEEKTVCRLFEKLFRRNFACWNKL